MADLAQPDAEMLADLELLLDMEILDSEADWDLIEALVSPDGKEPKAE